MHGVGSKWRANFGASVLCGMVVIQYYWLFMAAMGNYPYDGVQAYRWDCLESTKGGKISKAMFEEGSERALNPCYCNANATCKYKNELKIYNGSNPLGCPINDNFVCLANYNFMAFKTDTETKADREARTKVWPYIAKAFGDEGYRRDCRTGQKDRCTRTVSGGGESVLGRGRRRREAQSPWSADRRTLPTADHPPSPPLPSPPPPPRRPPAGPVHAVRAREAPGVRRNAVRDVLGVQQGRLRLRARRGPLLLGEYGLRQAR